MAKLIKTTKQDLENEIKAQKNDGFHEHEITVITKNKLTDINHLVESDVQFKYTGGTFGDKVAQTLTGEDTTLITLAEFDLSEERKQAAKEAIESGEVVIVVQKDKYSKPGDSELKHNANENEHHTAHDNASVENTSNVTNATNENLK